MLCTMPMVGMEGIACGSNGSYVRGQLLVESLSDYLPANRQGLSRGAYGFDTVSGRVPLVM